MLVETLCPVWNPEPGTEHWYPAKITNKRSLQFEVWTDLPVIPSQASVCVMKAKFMFEYMNQPQTGIMKYVQMENCL